MATTPRLSPEEVLEYTIEGQLVTLSPATAEQRNDRVTLTIDGTPVTVPRVVIAKDADQNPILDERGRNTYRYTTVYDAATELAIKQGKPNPIPVLCHREHLNPVGVCRMCMVEVRTKKGSEGLTAACKRIVDRDVEVHTADSPDPTAAERVRRVVRTVAELLSADQPDPTEHARPRAGGDVTHELPAIARRFEVPATPRFANDLRGRPKDASSLVISIDHSACVLCDRCVRACSDVKQNFVIGRTGRGYDARIGFDLDDPMGRSTCVSCGECAISCPTDAITFNEEAEQPLEPGGERISWEELVGIPLFRDVPPKFLAFNKGAYWRRRYRKGEVVCRQGEYGSTAFVIRRGRFEVRVADAAAVRKERNRLFGLLHRYRTVKTADDAEKAVKELTPDDLLFGEMTCLSNYPRAATVVALDDDCELIVVRRNVLHVLRRNTASRRLLEGVFRQNALGAFLWSVRLFEPLRGDAARFGELVEFLRERVELIQVNPKQVIYRQGDPARCVDLIRIGFVQVSQTAADGEQAVRNYVGPSSHIGELAILAGIPGFAASVDRFPPDVKPGLRSATVRAVDHVELIRIGAEDFKELYRRFPEIDGPIRDQIASYWRAVEADGAPRRSLVDSDTLGTFLEQGLVHARSLLVLDLEKCTRCDECTRACADAHDGTTRLIRDGLRFDKFLVASSCRACQDPYCMVGCPVDAIHRGPTGEMKIEDWCIGCGLCSSNCPYGNITMQKVRSSDGRWPIGFGFGRAALETRATICDLCADTGKDPSCVYACPHDAAHRMTGQELYELVNRAPAAV
ncbi:MAG TPA: cyclic nucleotide-binding domain-containing protein [Planctomycetaceae bacterium]